MSSHYLDFSEDMLGYLRSTLGDGTHETRIDLHAYVTSVTIFHQLSGNGTSILAQDGVITVKTRFGLLEDGDCDDSPITCLDTGQVGLRRGCELFSRKGVETSVEIRWYAFEKRCHWLIIHSAVNLSELNVGE